LSPRQREVFLLNRLEGYSFPQIAARLGISLSMVEKHAAKAVTKFDNNDQEDTKDVLRVHRCWLFNSTLSFDFSKGFTTRLIVNNVFDQEPSFAALAGTGGNFANATSQYFSGILGRSYLLAAEYRF
jgi:outer membrane receptor protein involved in Fe transport